MPVKLKSKSIHFRVEDSLKRESEKVFHVFGLSMAEGIRLFLNQVKITQSIPFSMKVPTKETLKALKESKNYKKLKKYKSHKELLKEMGISR